MPGRRTRSTTANMSTMAPTLPSLSVAEPSADAAASDLQTSRTNPDETMPKVQDDNEDYGDGSVGNVNNGEHPDDGIMYDDEDDDGNEARKTDMSVVGDTGKATDKSESDSGIELVSKHDEESDDEYNEADDEDQEGVSAKAKPVKSIKGKDQKKSEDKRKFGGSSKGRKCFRWTSSQEEAAIQGMLEIRAEGGILGDACFEELYKRLFARDPTWNHTVSGIHNAWHRRNLVREVIRAEARAKLDKREKQEKEDKALGLAFKAKRPTQRRSAKPRKYERDESPNDAENLDDEEPVISSKRRRLGSSGTLTSTNLRNFDANINRDLTPFSAVPATRYSAHTAPNLRNSETTVSRGLSVATLSTPPATMDSVQPLHDYPTVTVGFKRFNNTSRRVRDFVVINTMNRFWANVLATPMFAKHQTAFMVVNVLINNTQRTLNMAQLDKTDYAEFVRLVGEAVAAAGEQEVVVNVTSAL